MNIDITLDEPKKKNGGPEGVGHEHLGLQCCKYIKQRLEEYPNLKILALLFKKFLSVKNLNKPFSGGLSSYSLIQMILAILKLEEQYGLANKMKLGAIFKHFVFEYGYQFQPIEKGIGQDCLFKDKSELSYILHAQTCNINKPIEETYEMEIDSTQESHKLCTCGYSAANRKEGEGQTGEMSEEDQMMSVLKKLLSIPEPTGEFKKTPGSQAYHFNQPHLIIIDPLNKFNNIGKSSYNFAMIQQELRDVYSRLQRELVAFVKYRNQKNNDGIYKRRKSNMHTDPD